MAKDIHLAWFKRLEMSTYICDKIKGPKPVMVTLTLNISSGADMTVVEDAWLALAFWMFVSLSLLAQPSSICKTVDFQLL